MTGIFRHAGIVARSMDSAIAETSTNLAAYLTGRDIRVLVDRDGPFRDFDEVEAIEQSDLRERCDLLIAVGGDGTMLFAAALIAGAAIPLVGINRGRLGFLADIGPESMIDALGRVLDGQCVRESRMFLRASLAMENGETRTAVALNDIVVQKFDVGRMLEVEVHMDGTYVNTHRGDGLIISTPTGSTAYALSGGGPIMAPGLDAVAMVPICPHTLSDRPVVVPAAARLSLRVLEKTGSQAQIMADGILLANFSGSDTLSVTQAVERVTLLHPADYDYFRILRSKLAWGRDRAGH